MLKLFRRYRQSLIENSKATKYLWYAFGEIMLVVIGILIALQINNWNEGRKSALQEKLYLDRILSENIQDLSSFREAIADLEFGKKSIENFSTALKNTWIEDTTLIRSANEYFKYGSIYPVFTSSTSTFEDLASTGNLQVIKNTELREWIVRHYAQHKKVKERIQIGIDWALPLDAPFTFQQDIMQYEPLTAFLFPDIPQGTVAKQLSDNKIKYISNAAAHYWLNTDAIIHFNQLIEETEALISALEKELKLKQ